MFIQPPNLPGGQQHLVDEQLTTATHGMSTMNNNQQHYTPLILAWLLKSHQIEPGGGGGPLGAPPPSCGPICGPNICITALRASAACSGLTMLSPIFMWMPASVGAPGSPCPPPCPPEACCAWFASVPGPMKGKTGGTPALAGKGADGKGADGVWVPGFPAVGPWAFALTFA